MASGCASRSSELKMETDTGNQHWAAVAIVAGMVDVLQVEAGEDSAPHVRVVVSSQRYFPGRSSAHRRRVETPARRGPDSAGGSAEIPLDTNTHADLILRAMPSHLRLGRCRVRPSRPPRCRRRTRADPRSIPSAQAAKVVRQLLLQVDSEAVLHRGLQRMSSGFPDGGVLPARKSLMACR